MKKISLIVAIVMVLTLALVGCTPADTANEDTGATDTPEATDMAETDSGMIAISGSTSVYPAMEEIIKLFKEENPDVEIDLQAGGSSVGVKQAAAGEVDLGMASRDLKDAEIAENAGIQATVLCLDGVAIVVNAANGVEDLTQEQVKGMYTGEITNWSEVGGADMDVNLVTRDEASGTREAFTGLFLGKDDAGEEIEIDETICAAVVNSNGAVASTVEGDEGAIGYMSLGIVPEYDAIKATKVDGVVASTGNMSNGSYAYYRNFNLITMGAPAGHVADLIDFCTTDAVAAYLESKGYVMPGGGDAAVVEEEPGLSGEIAISGSTSVYPAMEEIIKMFGAINPDVEIDLQAGGSSVGVKQAAAGEVDLGMASRDLKDAEIAENDGIQATVLCLDGVAIVVNTANGVEDLTQEQVKGMYTGEITNWSEVGGADMDINLVTRDEASGTREAFTGLFLGKDDAGEKIEIDETICAAVVNSNGAVAQTVGGDEGAIGYMSLGIVPTYDTIKATMVDGVVATTDNMKSGDYAYYRNFNLITMGAPEGLVAALVDFCKTADVAAYLEGKGYVMPK